MHDTLDVEEQMRGGGSALAPLRSPSSGNRTGSVGRPGPGRGVAGAAVQTEGLVKHYRGRAG